MGSQQQIIVGVLLLAVAFIFGRYISNKPLDDTHQYPASLEDDTVAKQLPVTIDDSNTDNSKGNEPNIESTRAPVANTLQQSLRERILGKRLTAEQPKNQPAKNLTSESDVDLSHNNVELGMAKKLNQFKDDIVQPDFSNLALAESPTVERPSRSWQSDSELQNDPNVGLDAVTVGPLRDPPVVEPPLMRRLDADSHNNAKRRPPLDAEPLEVVAVRPNRDVNAQRQPSSGLTSTKGTLTRVQQRSHRLSIVAKEYLTHTSRPGDTLHAISNKYYGKPDYYLDIYFANRDQLQNPSLIPEGLQLKIPVYSN